MIKAGKVYFGIVLMAALVFMSACGGGSGSSSDVVESKRADKNEVIVHTGSDAQGLNPITTSDATASEVNLQTHQYLLYTDNDNFELVPLLAKTRPAIEVVEEDGVPVGMIMDFEIREEAKWDNGDPITGHDYAFTLKTIKCPAVSETGHLRPYFKFIDEVIVDEENPKKFRLICNKVYALAEHGAGNTVALIPAYNYDPDGLLAKYSVKELNDPARADEFKANPEMIKFAENFTSEKYQREAEYVVGSGAYKLVSWETGQRITLEKKKDWWGAELGELNDAFKAGPDKIIYEVIVDMATTLSATRDEGVDVCKDFQSKVWVEDLEKDAKFQQLYDMSNPSWIVFGYLGLNMRSPKLSDRNVRLALTHAYDVDYNIEVFSFGLSERTIGPFHPSQPYYNKDIVPYPFDLEKAKALLSEGGWEDTDGDGIRDKVVDGKKVDLDITIKFPQGSATRESIMLIYKNNLKEIGVNLELSTREWTVFLDELDKHDFEMYSGSWVNDPGPNDPYQLWHTESYNGGSNYCGFGDAESDALIEAIQVELDEAKRFEMYKEFQQIVHDEAPYIFASCPKKKVAIHNRFDNAGGKVTRVGYVPNAFLLNPTFGTGSKMIPAEN